MLSRRGFVNALVSLGFLVVAPRAGAAPPPRTPRRVRIDGRLSRAVFAALQNEPFRIALNGRVVAWTLTEITDGPVSAETEQFTVVSEARAGSSSRTASTTSATSRAGSARLFLQPSARRRALQLLRGVIQPDALTTPSARRPGDPLHEVVHPAGLPADEIPAAGRAAAPD